LCWARAAPGHISYDSAIETLTFLSSDIEGSTTILRRIGDPTYASVLAEHHRMVPESDMRFSQVSDVKPLGLVYAHIQLSVGFVTRNWADLNMWHRMKERLPCRL
jgi:hypothetical protein